MGTPRFPGSTPMTALRIARSTLPGAALAAMLSVVTPAAAGTYIAVDGSSVTLGAAFDDDLNPRGGRLRLGLRVSEAFDVEAHVGRSGDDDTGAFDSVEASWAGAYLKGYLPLGERSALFALGGVAGVALDRTVDDIEVSDERRGFSYGFGLETELTERLDLSADWMRYAGDEEGEVFERIDAVSLGLKLYF